MKANADHRKRESVRKARYRRRHRDDIKVYPTPLPAEEVETLIELQWITEEDSRNRRKVGEAIAAALKTLKRK